MGGRQCAVQMSCPEVSMCDRLHLEISYTFVFLQMYLLKCASNQECYQVSIEVILFKCEHTLYSYRFEGPATPYQECFGRLDIVQFPVTKPLVGLISYCTWVDNLHRPNDKTRLTPTGD